jgi:bacillithiol system protein YtxJ
MAQWHQITTLDEWNQVLKTSLRKPVLLLKHSTACPISANAWREWHSFVSEAPQHVLYVMVKVIESRPVSNQIASDLQVKHESPQAILIQNQKAVWNTSHWDITKSRLKQVIQQQ